MELGWFSIQLLFKSISRKWLVKILLYMCFIWKHNHKQWTIYSFLASNFNYIRIHEHESTHLHLRCAYSTNNYKIIPAQTVFVGVGNSVCFNLGWHSLRACLCKQHIMPLGNTSSDSSKAPTEWDTRKRQTTAWTAWIAERRIMRVAWHPLRAAVLLA